jgi:DNA replication and repair protein RecF
LRKRSIAGFQSVFNELLEGFIAVKGIALSYQRGWDRERDYADVLADSIERDHRQGFTHSGVHRADLRITVDGLPAADVLSRGQQKLLVCALKIAQGVLFGQLTGRKCVYLVDDLPAELDQKHRAQLVNWLDTMETQVFITGVEKDSLLIDWLHRPAVATKLFHVEQGRVSAVTESSVTATE